MSKKKWCPCCGGKEFVDDETIIQLKQIFDFAFNDSSLVMAEMTDDIRDMYNEFISKESD